MKTTKGNITKRIFWVLLILSIVIGYIFYNFLQGQFSLKFLIFFSGVPFLLFATGAFGLLWPKIKPKGDEIYITHALVVGVIFIVLFFIHVWIILPHICPDFGSCLGV
ncbi:hypothetical protein [Mangrovimonas spongiae]|uniref:Uncharacterized protein n=1 Tax=Mangrovimonas spongiae TaxID=2494697 RepID=A0A428JY46_9FLAO|nr:hypothetical protein [Mangrovimonas spongiae]RSK39061.1 hypothetical protein EJA19_08960 [Mangrovimonas spongiae]